MEPFCDITTPEPNACWLGFCCCWSKSGNIGPKNFRNCSMSAPDICWCWPPVVTKTFTTLGVTDLTIGAKEFPSFTSRVSGELSTCNWRLAFAPLSFGPEALKASVPPARNAAAVNAAKGGIIAFLGFINGLFNYWPNYARAHLTRSLLEHYKGERKTPRTSRYGCAPAQSLPNLPDSGFLTTPDASRTHRHGQVWRDENLSVSYR